jgi:KaiC/GvpD/RAD55 family RecA-like ATPase
MILSELIQRSPIRILEQSIHGGLKAGEIGIIASQAGVGKTSVLVQIALDKLLQGKKVIHVSFTQHTHNVLSWYGDIFGEIINERNLENATDVKNELMKNRVLMNFNQDGISKEQIIKSLRAMILEGGFAAEAIIIDGYNFSRSSQEQITCVKAFARELGLSVWYSCTIVDGDRQYEHIPPVLKDIVDLIDVVIVLDPQADHIALSISKDRDTNDTKSLAMRLDPRTLLILEK